MSSIYLITVIIFRRGEVWVIAVFLRVYGALFIY